MWRRPCLFLALLLAASGQAEAAASHIPMVQGPDEALPPELEEVKRTTFRVWCSHGDFEPSLNAEFLYFGENGPDGLVLKRASLSNGKLEVVAETPGREAYHLAAIPGDPGHLALAWQAGIGAADPYGASVLDLSSGRQRILDVGSSWGDGRIYVSPSGRFLATGSAVMAPVRGPWCPSEIAVFNVATGRRELTYKIPLHDEKAMVPNPGSESATAVRVRIPDTMRVDWTTDDVLVLSDGAETSFRRVGDSRWVKSARTGEFVAQTGTVWKFYPGEQLRVRRASGRPAVDLMPEKLFGPGPLRTFYVYNLPGYAVVASEAKATDGWGTIQVVVLKWKVAQAR